MTEMPPELFLELVRDDDDVGEFLLPHVEPGLLVAEDERDGYDEQILAGLVSP